MYDQEKKIASGSHRNLDPNPSTSRMQCWHTNNNELLYKMHSGHSPLSTSGRWIEEERRFSTRKWFQVISVSQLWNVENDPPTTVMSAIYCHISQLYKKEPIKYSIHQGLSAKTCIRITLSIFSDPLSLLRWTQVKSKNRQHLRH